MEIQGQSTGMLSLFGAIPREQFSSNAETIFVDVFTHKQISVNQLIDVLTPDTRKGSAFTSVLQLLTQILIENEVKVIYARHHNSPRIKRVISTPEVLTEKITQELKINPPFSQKVISQTSTERISTKKATQVKQRKEKNIRYEVDVEKLAQEEYFYGKEETTFYWFLRQIHHPILKYETLVQLVTDAQSGDIHARNSIMEHNQRLVVSIAKHYWGGDVNLIMDLIQEANFGLITAISKFDTSMDLQFSTYAMWWIKQSITRYLDDKVRIVRYPVHMEEQLRKVRALNNRLYQQLERDPTSSELLDEALKLGISHHAIDLIYSKTSSLDVFENTDGEFVSPFAFIEDKSKISAIDLIEAKEKLGIKNYELEKLIAIVGNLNIPPRNQQMFYKRYQINGEKDGKRELEKIGQHYGITRERVRQICEVIWKLIRKNGGKMTEDDLQKRLMSIELLKTITNTSTVGYEIEGTAFSNINISNLNIDKNIVEKMNEEALELEIELPKLNMSEKIKTSDEPLLIGSVIALTISIVSKFYDISEEVITSKSQKEEVVHAQHVAMYILREYYKISLSEIARKFNEIDHAPIRNACISIEYKLRRESDTASDIRYLIELLDFHKEKPAQNK